jgi:hypothetical protein
VWNFERLKERERERRLLRLRLVFLVVMIAALIALGGCDLPQKLQALMGKPPAESASLPDLGAGGLSTLPPPADNTKVTVYFKDQTGHYLVPFTAEVNKTAGIAKMALEALCAGPPQGDLQASLPAGTQVRSINIKTNGACVVDLALPAHAKLTLTQETLAVYAIVNTLTEFHNVKRVQILESGRAQKTFAGHIPIDEPLIRNPTFIKK